MADQPAEKPTDRNERACTAHSVVRFRVTRASPRCPVFRKGDEFFVRQHVLDTEVSTVRNFCYHSLTDLYAVYARVRQLPVGGREELDCRDKAMVHFEVERLPDEHAAIGRAEVPNPPPHPFVR